MSKLPPPATGTVDFIRDILPIFEQSCLRCHGAEKPKGGLRLDHREPALKGGDNGVAIRPGDSTNSPLIHLVARLVPDSEMPPTGKGDPLTPEQVGLLRAWIDQGASWPESASTDQLLFSITPRVQWLGVSGNEQKFRQHTGQREGWSGGASRFELEQALDPDTRLKLEGRALARQEDYQIALELRRVDTGFIRTGYEEFRKYYDDTGGFYEPFGLAPMNLGRDLHLDSGKAFLDLGLTLPDWPRMTLGYEYRFREGTKSTLQWGGVTVGGTTKSIYPAFKEIDEQVHVIKFDLEHELAGVRIEDRFRGEFYDLQTRRPNADFFTFNFGSQYSESYQHFQGANSFHLEKQVRDWLFVSGGHLYSRLSGEGSFQQVAFGPVTGAIFPAPSDQTPLAVMKSSSQVINLNSRLGPWEGLSFTAATQGDWTRTEGFGNGTVFGFPTRSAHSYGSNLDKQVFEERFGLRYDRIPFTVVNLDTRFRQESLGQFEQELIADGFGTDKDFLRDSDMRGNLKEFKGGISVSPWTAVTFSTSYRRRHKDDTYDHLTDTDLTGTPGNGYPDLLQAREETTDEVEARLAVRLTRWLRTTLKYELTSTEFTHAYAPVATFFPIGGAPGGSLLAGNYDAHTYSLNATLTPWSRLYLNSSLIYSETRQISGVNDGVAIVPFGGGTWSVIHSGTFVVNDRTDFLLTHSFSEANYGQANFAALPLGLNYSLHGIQAGLTRRIKDGLTTGLQYLFQRYAERGTGGAGDYTAHGVFGTLTWKLN